MNHPTDEEPLLSSRLVAAIEGGCHEVDPLLVDSLAESIRGGGMAFFVNEFAAAIRAGVFTPTLWGRLTTTDLDPDDEEQLDKDLRYVWSKVAPGRSYPGDE